MGQSFTVEAIGRVKSPRTKPVDDDWDLIATQIELDPTRFSPECLWGLSDFSHIEVFYIFDRVPTSKIEVAARHPRGRADWPRVGIFAQRGKNRPNRMGATICEVLSVNDLTVKVRGLDAIDNTPVIDIKPVMSGFERRSDLREPDWAVDIMSSYWG